MQGRVELLQKLGEELALRERKVDAERLYSYGVNIIYDVIETGVEERGCYYFFRKGQS